MSYSNSGEAVTVSLVFGQGAKERGLVVNVERKKEFVLLAPRQLTKQRRPPRRRKPRPTLGNRLDRVLWLIGHVTRSRGLDMQ